MSDFYNKYPYTDFHELNLDWVIERVKKLTEDWLATQQEWNDTEEQWQQLHDYVMNYFANLDVQDEINNKINTMIADGTFLNIIRSTVEAQTTTATENWLAAHISQPTTPAVDNTLTIAGAAADAKTVGDLIQRTVDILYDNTIIPEFVQGVRFPQTLDIISPSNVRCTVNQLLYLHEGDVINCTNNTAGQKYSISSVNYDSGWQTGNFSLVITNEDYYSMTVAMADGTSNITPNDIGLQVNVEVNSTVSAENAENYIRSVPTLNVANPIYDMYSNLEHIAYDIQNNQWQNLSYRLCVRNPMLAAYDMKVVAKSGYKFCIYLWNGATWQSGLISASAWKTSGTIDANSYYSLVIGKTNDGYIDFIEGINVYAYDYKYGDFVQGQIDTNLLDVQSEVNIILRNKSLFVNKVFNGSTFTDASYRMCNPTLLYADKSYKFKTKGIYQITPYMFKTNDATQTPVEYGSPWSNSCVIPKGYYFGLNIRKSDNSTVVLNDMLENVYEDDIGYLYDKLEKYTDFTQYLKNHKYVISGFDVKSVNAQCMTFDAATGYVYIVYMASNSNYGESSQKILLSRFLLAKPQIVETFTVAENGVSGVDTCYEPNILMLTNSVRIIYATIVNNEYVNVYTDFDKTTSTFSTPVNQKYEDNTDVSTNNTKQYLTDHGYDISGMSIAYQAMTNFSHEHNGYIYTVLTSHKQIAILCRSSDNMATIERLCFLPYLTVGEIALGFINNRLYMLARLDPSVESNDNFYYTDDMNTIVEIGHIDMALSKPTIEEYDNKLLICRNTAQAGIPTVNTMGRYQITISLFDGTTMIDLIKANNYYGIVYTMIKNYKGQLIATFSEGSLFYDINTEGKDTVDFVNFGLISDLLL